MSDTGFSFVAWKAAFTTRGWFENSGKRSPTANIGLVLSSTSNFFASSPSFDASSIAAAAKSAARSTTFCIASAVGRSPSFSALGRSKCTYSTFRFSSVFNPSLRES